MNAKEKKQGVKSAFPFAHINPEPVSLMAHMECNTIWNSSYQLSAISYQKNRNRPGKRANPFHQGICFFFHFFLDIPLFLPYLLTKLVNLIRYRNILQDRKLWKSQ
jgi:hypothetical protein